MASRLLGKRIGLVVAFLLALPLLCSAQSKAFYIIFTLPNSHDTIPLGINNWLSVTGYATDDLLVTMASYATRLAG